MPNNKRLFAVIALIEVDGDTTHEQAYDLVDKQFADSDTLAVMYRDIDSNWRQYRVLAENADVPDPLAIGTYVQTRTHGHRGRIYQVHNSCPEGAAWRMGQQPGLVGEHADGGGTWYSVLVQPSGSVVVPDYDIDVVDPFEFTNSYGDEYFGGRA